MDHLDHCIVRAVRRGRRLLLDAPRTVRTRQAKLKGRTTSPVTVLRPLLQPAPWVRERILGACKGTITVDQNKINADSKKAKENVQAFGDKTKEAVGADTEKVTPEGVPADAD